jgi:branched-subunit amino acid ABC-type transport system permease component
LDLLYLDLAQGLILVFGGIVVYFAWRAYGRMKSQAMLLLGLGFAFVTAGAVIAGIMYNYLTGDLTTVVTIQAYSQAVGFFIIVYSLAKAKD